MNINDLVIGKTYKFRKSGKVSSFYNMLHVEFEPENPVTVSTLTGVEFNNAGLKHPANIIRFIQSGGFNLRRLWVDDDNGVEERTYGVFGITETDLDTGVVYQHEFHVLPEYLEPAL